MDFNQMNHDVLLRILSWTLWKDIPMLGVLRKTCKRFLALLTPASIGTWEESNTTSDFLHNCLPRDGAGYTEQWHLESPMALMRMFIPYVLYSGLETVGNLIYNIIPTAKNENEPADLFSILVCSVEWGVFVDVLGRSCLWISWRNLPCTSKADRESAAKHLFCLRCASLHFLEGFHYCYSDGISPDRDSSLEILNVGLRGSDDVCFRKLCVEGIWVSSTKSHVTVLRLHRKISDDLRQALDAFYACVFDLDRFGPLYIPSSTGKFAESLGRIHWPILPKNWIQQVNLLKEDLPHLRDELLQVAASFPNNIYFQGLQEDWDGRLKEEEEKTYVITS